jgi:hypothetical protein
MEEYILVRWPESQMLMEYDWFESECILMNDEDFLDEIGSSAYFVPLLRWESFIKKQ